MTAQQVPLSTPSSHPEGVSDRYRGTFRTQPPEQTWALIAPHLLRAGITRVTDHTGLDDLGIPVFGAVRPVAACNHYALGKGVSPLLSRISACMEGLEVWHAETAEADSHETTRAELLSAGHSAMKPSWFARGSAPRIGDQVRMDWARGATLAGEPVWVPHEAVRLDRERQRLLPVSTNGLASGNTRDEAVLHGLLELCERDAIATFLAQFRCRQIDLASVSDPECRSLLDTYMSHNFDVVLLDVTNDLDVPTVLAFIRSAPDDWIFCGAGAHLNLAIATSRALTEAAQLRLIVRLGIRDDVDDRFDQSPGATCMTVPSWVPTGLFGDVPADETRSLSADVSHVHTLLQRQRGLDPIVVDLTRADMGIPVVKVLAPSAAEDLSFFGPRRSLPVPDNANATS